MVNCKDSRLHFFPGCSGLRALQLSYCVSLVRTVWALVAWRSKSIQGSYLGHTAIPGFLPWNTLERAASITFRHSMPIYSSRGNKKRIAEYCRRQEAHRNTLALVETNFGSNLSGTQVAGQIIGQTLQKTLAARIGSHQITLSLRHDR